MDCIICYENFINIENKEEFSEQIKISGRKL